MALNSCQKILVGTWYSLFTQTNRSDRLLKMCCLLIFILFILFDSGVLYIDRERRRELPIIPISQHIRGLLFEKLYIIIRLTNFSSESSWNKRWLLLLEISSWIVLDSVLILVEPCASILKFSEPTNFENVLDVALIVVIFGAQSPNYGRTWAHAFCVMIAVAFVWKMRFESPRYGTKPGYFTQCTLLNFLTAAKLPQIANN